jgi:hypothetical protein
LPFADKNTTILVFRHAMSLDERRVKFRPFHYTSKKFVPNGAAKATRGHRTERTEDTLVDQEQQSSDGDEIPEHETDYEEVFFAGVHCDVGGGSVKNGERNSLARIPLRWMIREAFNTNTDIIFDACMLRHEVGLDMDKDKQTDEDICPTSCPPEPLPPVGKHSALTAPRRNEHAGFSLKTIPRAVASTLVSPFSWAAKKLRGLCVRDLCDHKNVEARSKRKGRSKEEAKEERKDALSPIFDEMKIHPFWKFFEIVPWIVKRQANEDTDIPWPYGWVRNRKKGRVLYKDVMDRGIRVHRSVKTRIEAEPMEGTKKRYRPKIQFTIYGEKRRLSWEEWTAHHPKHFVWVDQ